MLHFSDALLQPSVAREVLRSRSVVATGAMLALQPSVGSAAHYERGRAALRVGASATSRARPLPQRRARLVVAAGVSRAAVAAAAVPEAVLKAYQRLQNGSDVRGVALPGVAGQDVTLSPERCACLPQRLCTEKGN